MKTLLHIVLLCAASILSAQPVLIAEADRYKVGLGEEVRVSFRFEGDGKKFEAPSFGSDWAVLAGPNRSFQTSIINGRINQVQRFDFLIRPRKMGQLTVPSARILYEGDWVLSKPMKIEVQKASAREVPPNDPRARAAKNSFMKLRISKRKVYVGEPLILDYVLYYNDAEMPQEEEPLKFPGFYQQELELEDAQRRGQEVVDNQNYRTYIWRRVLLIPQLSGAKIEGQALVMIPTYIPSNQRDIFGRRQQQLVRQRAILEAPSIQVLAIPSKGRPDSFSGAVGQFDFDLELNPEEVAADGSVSLKMRLSGTGNLNMLSLPEPIFPKEFEVFDPEEREQVRNGGFGQKGSRSKEYLLIPRYRGTYKIAPIRFSYFDPKKETFVEVEKGPTEIRVIGGKEAPVGSAAALAGSASGVGKQQVAPLQEDIRFISLGAVSWSKVGEEAISYWWWLLMLLPLALMLGVQMYLHRQQQQERFGAEIRASKAFKKARRDIQSSSKNGEKAEVLMHIMEAYFIERFKMGRSDLEEMKIVEVLRKKTVQNETIEQWTKLYRQLLGSRFAPSSDDSQSNAKQLLEVLGQIEKQATR